jgi:hypothetical protein
LKQALDFLMILRLFSQLRFTRHGFLSLALLPAFLYGTLPHTACICADGHREEHCRALSRHTSAPQSAAKSECSCCKAREGAPSCCQAGEHQSSACHLLTTAGTCCQPIVESPAPLVPSAKVQSPEKSALLATVAPIPEYWSADSFCTPHWRHLSTPPPLDVVIVYLHLTI